ncbi:MAG: hypothetical protein ACLKAL_08865 [Alkaliphilus sp.]
MLLWDKLNSVTAENKLILSKAKDHQILQDKLDDLLVENKVLIKKADGKQAHVHNASTYQVAHQKRSFDAHKLTAIATEYDDILKLAESEYAKAKHKEDDERKLIKRLKQYKENHAYKQV